MRKSPPELPEEEALAILRAYPADAGEVTKELLVFGRLLVDASNQRAGSLDSKATAILGYAGVMLAFLIAHSGEWAKHFCPSEAWGIAAASTAILVAIVASGWAVRGQRWSWFSAKDWIRADVLGNVESQRRYYVSVTQKVHRRNEQVNERKATAVVTAQVALAVGTALLGVVLALHSALHA